MLSKTDHDLPADRDPVVVTAADDNFAMSLAATMRSAIDHLAPGRKLKIFVLDGGISDENKDRILRSWPADRHQTAWVTGDASVLSSVPVSGHVNFVSYLRILMPWLLPAELSRVLYLDADLIIRTDLMQLWDRPLNGQLCLAAQDCAAPFVDCEIALANFDRCRPYLGTPRPIPNYRELGIDPKARYFNAGVMHVNLAAWRSADLPAQMLACLHDHKQHVTWWDQYALNVAMTGRWGCLDQRWNQAAIVHSWPNWSASPYDRMTFEQVRNDPYIVHFTTCFKPWLPSCIHPRRKEFFHYLDRTDWAGWRPSRLKRVQAVLQHLKVQERRFRRGRRELRSTVSGWLQRQLKAA